MADRLNYFIVETVINYFQAVKFEKPAGFHCLYSTPFLFPCPCWHILPVMFSLECQWKYTGAKPADWTRNNLVQKNLSPPSSDHVIGDNELM